MSEAKVFESWAILELMGHRRLGGFVSEVEMAGVGMFRIDVPELVDGDTRHAAATQFYAPAAVYAITPTTEEIARAVRSRPAPVHAFELPQRAGGGAASVQLVDASDFHDEDEHAADEQGW